MQETIREISQKEIYDIAKRFNIDIGDATVSEIKPQVNARLKASLEQIYEININRELSHGGRTWWTKKDPYNAISTHCNVPSSKQGPLSGVKVGLKDNIAVAGVPMRCGSAALQEYIPRSDALVVDRLLNAGAHITSKTNLDAFAVGGRGTSFEGNVINPNDESRSTGGSSGGSAAAVAAGYTDVSLGTDTGGSVRIPAAFCGLYGYKPSYGLIPTDGVVENTYSLDHIGTITKTLTEAAELLEVIAGPHKRDPASMRHVGINSDSNSDYIHHAKYPPEASDISLGVLSHQYKESISAPVIEQHNQALDILENSGINIKKIPFEHLELITRVKDVISYCELATGWRDGAIPYRRGGTGVGENQLGIANRLLTGSRELNDFHLSRLVAGAALIEKYNGRHYVQAHRARRTLQTEFDKKMTGLDAIVTPTAPHLAPKIASNNNPDALGGDTDLGTGLYTKIANVTGNPAVTLPNGSSDGSPIGLQLIGHRSEDAILIGVAARVTKMLK